MKEKIKYYLKTAAKNELQGHLISFFFITTLGLCLGIIVLQSQLAHTGYQTSKVISFLLQYISLSEIRTLYYVLLVTLPVYYLLSIPLLQKCASKLGLNKVEPSKKHWLLARYWDPTYIYRVLSLIVIYIYYKTRVL